MKKKKSARIDKNTTLSIIGAIGLIAIFFIGGVHTMILQKVSQTETIKISPSTNVGTNTVLMGIGEESTIKTNANGLIVPKGLEVVKKISENNVIVRAVKVGRWEVSTKSGRTKLTICVDVTKEKARKYCK